LPIAWCLIGLVKGYTSPTDNDAKKAHYELIQSLAQSFTKENGSIICRELLNLPSGDVSPKPEERTTAYYKKRPCAELCGDAAEILEDYLKNK
jgi:hypothetical protein